MLYKLYVYIFSEHLNNHFNVLDLVNQLLQTDYHQFININLANEKCKTHIYLGIWI